MLTTTCHRPPSPRDFGAGYAGRTGCLGVLRWRVEQSKGRLRILPRRLIGAEVLAPGRSAFAHGQMSWGDVAFDTDLVANVLRDLAGSVGSEEFSVT